MKRMSRTKIEISRCEDDVTKSNRESFINVVEPKSVHEQYVMRPPKSSLNDSLPLYEEKKPVIR